MLLYHMAHKTFFSYDALISQSLKCAVDLIRTNISQLCTSPFSYYHFQGGVHEFACVDIGDGQILQMSANNYETHWLTLEIMDADGADALSSVVEYTNSTDPSEMFYHTENIHLIPHNESSSTHFLHVIKEALIDWNKAKNVRNAIASSASQAFVDRFLQEALEMCLVKAVDHCPPEEAAALIHRTIAKRIGQSRVWSHDNVIGTAAQIKL